MMRHKTCVAVFTVLLVLTGCVGGGSRGAPDFQHYQTAFQAQHAAGVRVLDRLSLAERKLIAQTSGAPSNAFDPDQAAAFLKIGDPPRTALLRGGLEALSAYNLALGDILTGKNSQAGLVGVLTNLTSIAQRSPVRARSAATGLHALAVRLGQVQPFIARLGQARDGEAFRARLIATHPSMREMLLALRSATPQIFQILRAAQVEPGNLDDPEGLSSAAREAVESDRRLLAAWVVLIDHSIVAMDRAVAAARTGGKQDIAALLTASIRLRALSDALRFQGVN